MTSAGDTPTANASTFEYLLFGLWAYIGNYIYDLFTLKSRQQKLARQKAEVLPQFPRTLVCPKCLELKKRP